LDTVEDPRLGPLPHGWWRENYERLVGDPEIFQKFRNIDTGEVVNYDPRLSPETLELAGVALQAFKLV
jgi:hypothetical protein